MKKNSKKLSVAPEQAVEFLEAFRIMNAGLDEPTLPISIRILANILRAIRIKAKAENKKYQSVMVEYLRKGLRETI